MSDDDQPLFAGESLAMLAALGAIVVVIGLVAWLVFF